MAHTKISDLTSIKAGFCNLNYVLEDNLNTPESWVSVNPNYVFTVASIPKDFNLVGEHNLKLFV
jgi:hypothetical protein